MSTAIRLLTLEDLDGYIEHIGAHATESGRDGDPVFMPYGKDKPFVAAPSRELREKSWAVAVGEPGWNRCWGFFDGETWVAGFYRPEFRTGYQWVGAYFDGDGIYNGGYWEPAEDKSGQVWIPGWFDGSEWEKGYWVSEREYRDADIDNWSIIDGR